MYNMTMQYNNKIVKKDDSIVWWISFCWSRFKCNMFSYYTLFPSFAE